MNKSRVLNELEELVCKKEGGVDLHAIANWAYRARLDSLRELDRDLLDILEELGTMDMGPEFEWSEDDLRSLVAKLKAPESTG